MKITVVGRGNVGGGLAKCWQAAGHSVTTLGRDGGDASDAEQLIRDAGYGPISVGGLENARLLEDQIDFIMAIAQGGLGQSFYRYWAP